MAQNARRSGDAAQGNPLRVSFTSTEAQNNFGQVLERAARGGPVFITRYDRPQAVVLSIEEYSALLRDETVDLESLEREFDAMLEAMQSQQQRNAVDALFSMTGEELGEAAARGAAQAG